MNYEFPFIGQVGLTRPLNYSQDTNVRFVITATDNGFPPLTSTATVYVQLKNSNDYPPVFNTVRQSYVFM